MQTAFSVLSFHFTLRETFSLSYTFFLLSSLFPTTYYYEVIFHLHFPALQKRKKEGKKNKRNEMLNYCLVFLDENVYNDPRVNFRICIWFIDRSFIHDDKSLNNSTIIFMLILSFSSHLANKKKREMSSRR